MKALLSIEGLSLASGVGPIVSDVSFEVRPGEPVTRPIAPAPRRKRPRQPPGREPQRRMPERPRGAVSPAAAGARRS